MNKLAILALAALAPQLAEAKTWLVSAGSNRSFDEALPALDYATVDAEQFAEAIRSVGMTKADHATIQKDPTRAALLEQLDLAAKAFARSKDGSAEKFIFYFSGHADERGLHLRDTLFSKEELHQSLERIPARTKVVVLDSCYAGALAFKGVRPVEGSLAPRITLDEPSGSVFLTAASARDVAVEAKALRGSLFTRSLVTGLYGEADANADGVVTANELYEYAFRQTQLTSYMMPVGSPQKPELVADLKGYGAVTLSVLAGKMGKLHLGEQLAGKVAIQSLKGVSSFEVTKPKGALAVVPLPVGSYRLWIKDGAKIGEGEIEVKRDLVATLDVSQLRWRSDVALAATKGPTAEVRAEAPREPPTLHVLAGLVASKRGGSFAVAAQRGNESGSGLAVTLAYRSTIDDHYYGDLRETRTGVYIGYIAGLTSVRDFGIRTALDLGVGMAASRFHLNVGERQTHRDYARSLEENEDEATSGSVSYAAIRYGLRIGAFTDRVWLTFVQEEALRDESRASPLAPRTWQTLGIGASL